MTGSAVSISNTSFVTASDGDVTDEELDSSNSELSDDTFTGGRYETETYVDSKSYSAYFVAYLQSLTICFWCSNQL